MQEQNKSEINKSSEILLKELKLILEESSISEEDLTADQLLEICLKTELDEISKDELITENLSGKAQKKLLSNLNSNESIQQLIAKLHN